MRILTGPARAFCAMMLLYTIGCSSDATGPTPHPGGLSPLSFVGSPASPSAAGAAFNPAIRVVAANANGTPDSSFSGVVTLALGPGHPDAIIVGSLTANAVHGVAVFPGVQLLTPGIGYTLRATAAGRDTAYSAAFDVERAALLSFSRQPGPFTPGVRMSPGVQVAALDAGGHPLRTVTGEVTVSLAANRWGAVLSGTTHATFVDGVATFDDLAIDKVGDDFVLTAVAADFISATSAPFRSDQGLAFSREPEHVTAGQPFSPTVQVTARDAAGNTITGFNGEITLTLASTPAGAVLLGTTHVAAVNGVATFGDLTIDRPANAFVLTASAPGYRTATSGSFGSVGRLAFTTQPSDVNIDTPMAPAVVVTVLDALGAVDQTFYGTVTLSLRANPAGATLIGTPEAQAAAGVATFSNLRVDRAAAALTLVAHAGSLTDGVSTTFAATHVSPWTVKAPPPLLRYAASAAVSNGLLYLIGGYNPDYEPIPDVEAYDPTTDSWTTRTAMPRYRAGLAVGVVNGIIYVVGCGSNSVDSYDPATNAWTARPPMLSAHCVAGANAIAGKLVVAGGPGTSVEAFDPLTGTWTVRAAMPSPRSEFAMAAANGMLYAVGGAVNLYVRTLESYDPGTNAWTTHASMATGRTYLGVGVLGNTLYAVGGNRNGPSAANSVEQYDLLTGQWAPGPPLPEATGPTTAAVINGVIYAITDGQLFAYHP